MKNVICNEFLSLQVKTLGAEICSLISNETKTEYIWQADPKFWAKHAPLLFPIAGLLKDNQYTLEGKVYRLPRHGFVRDFNHEIVEQDESKIKFRFVSNDKTLEVYPFKFEFYTTYSLVGKTLEVVHEVVNKDDKMMYFSIGAHPAFNCPIGDGNQYIELDKATTLAYYGQDPVDGLMEHSKTVILENDNKLKLDFDMFSRTSLFFDCGDIDSTILVDANHGEVLKMTFKGFTYFGLWTMVGAPYICIEPWYGLADFKDTNGELKDKIGIEKLEVGEMFKCSYQIEVK